MVQPDIHPLGQLFKYVKGFAKKQHISQFRAIAGFQSNGSGGQKCNALWVTTHIVSQITRRYSCFSTFRSIFLNKEPRRKARALLVYVSAPRLETLNDDS